MKYKLRLAFLGLVIATSLVTEPIKADGIHPRQLVNRAAAVASEQTSPISKAPTQTVKMQSAARFLQSIDRSVLCDNLDASPERFEQVLGSLVDSPMVRMGISALEKTDFQAFCDG